MNRGVVFRALPALVVTAAIFVGGSLRLDAAPASLPSDKWQHAVAFGVLAALAMWPLEYAFRRFPLAARLSAVTVSSCVFSCLVGGVLEIVQSFIPYRTADWYDWLADALGAGVAVVVAGAVVAVRERSVGRGEVQSS